MKKLIYVLLACFTGCVTLKQSNYELSKSEIKKLHSYDVKFGYIEKSEKERLKDIDKTAKKVTKELPKENTVKTKKVHKPINIPTL